MSVFYAAELCCWWLKTEITVERGRHENKNQLPQQQRYKRERERNLDFKTYLDIKILKGKICLLKYLIISDEKLQKTCPLRRELSKYFIKETM